MHGETVEFSSDEASSWLNTQKYSRQHLKVSRPVFVHPCSAVLSK